MEKLLQFYNTTVVKSKCLRCIFLPLTHYERRTKNFICFAGERLELRNQYCDRVEKCKKFLDRNHASKISGKILFDSSIIKFEKRYPFRIMPIKKYCLFCGNAKKCARGLFCLDRRILGDLNQKCFISIAELKIKNEKIEIEKK